MFSFCFSRFASLVLLLSFCFSRPGSYQGIASAIPLMFRFHAPLGAGSVALTAVIMTSAPKGDSSIHRYAMPEGMAFYEPRRKTP
jgi:hypothetical protein